MTLKKSYKNPKQKIYSSLDLFFRHFKMKKHLSETPLIEWNYLTPRSIILVARIDVNADILFLSLKSGDFLISLSNHEF
jgi:hypothetical protein